MDAALLIPQDGRSAKTMIKRPNNCLEMNILMVISQFHPIIAGADKQAQLLAKELIEKGLKVTIVTGWWRINTLPTALKPQSFQRLKIKYENPGRAALDNSGSGRS